MPATNQEKAKTEPRRQTLRGENLFQSDLLLIINQRRDVFKNEFI